MLRDTDVPTMMIRVEATLDAAERSPNGASGVMRVANEGDRHLNVGKARQLAGIELEFPASSDRAFVGRAVSVCKRVLRRSLRWYVTPMIQQQTRFNHIAVDLFEGLRLSLDRLARRIDSLQPAAAVDGANLLEGCARALELDAGDGGLGFLTEAEPGALDGVLARTATADAATVAAVLEAAITALAPGGRLAVVTTDAAPVPAAAVAWAAEAAGFAHARTVPLEGPVAGVAAGPQSLADQLEQVAQRLSEPRAVAVLGVKPRVRL